MTADRTVPFGQFRVFGISSESVEPRLTKTVNAADRANMGSPFVVVACVFAVLLSAGCGGVANNTPRSAAQAYERAIVSKDGNELCATFAPKLREVLAEQIEDQEVAAGSTERKRFDCGAFYHVVLNGFPHENIDREFVAATLLGIGRQSRVRRAGRVYFKVTAKLRIEFVYTGYSIHGDTRGKKGTAIVEDAVWLAKARDGRWGVVKPSLALLAAGTPDVLYERWQVDRANAAPPDPDYSMNRAERTAWEAADYRASRRRTIGHTALRCSGQTVSVADPPRDANPTRSSLHPVRAPQSNDITRVTVQVSRRRMCVTVTFRKSPSGRLRLGFMPRSRHKALGVYVVEIDAARGVRGGVAGSYRYFRGGDHLRRNTVGAISRYRRHVAFVANARLPPSALMWSMFAATSGGRDTVPNAAPGSYVLIRQRTGRAITP